MGDKIKAAARGKHCTIRLPGCTNDRDTVIFAHAPSIDNGMGLRQAKDFWGAFCCNHCHKILDGKISSIEEYVMVLQRWIAGIYETQKILIEEELMQYDDH